MKALLIDYKTRDITEVEHDGNWRNISTTIGNGCRNFEAALRLPNRDTFYCDEEGLYNPELDGGIRLHAEGMFVTSFIKGNIIVLGADEEGETTAVRSSIEDVEKLISFFTEAKQ